MKSNAPENYTCPICLGIQSIENDDTLIRQNDIVYKDDLATVFIGSFFTKNNPGYPIIVPNEHFENIYDLPTEQVRRIADLTKYFSLAVKEVRNCDGITILQNNEPASNQHAFHYHMHVIPRFTDDRLILNVTQTRISTKEERKPYADNLRKYIANNPITL
jgi:histidine triad (HIT) family protein